MHLHDRSRETSTWNIFSQSHPLTRLGSSTMLKTLYRLQAIWQEPSQWQESSENGSLSRMASVKPYSSSDLQVKNIPICSTVLRTETKENWATPIRHDSTKPLDNAGISQVEWNIDGTCLLVRTGKPSLHLFDMPLVTIILSYRSDPKRCPHLHLPSLSSFSSPSIDRSPNGPPPHGRHPTILLEPGLATTTRRDHFNGAGSAQGSTPLWGFLLGWGLGGRGGGQIDRVGGWCGGGDTHTDECVVPHRFGRERSLMDAVSPRSNRNIHHLRPQMGSGWRESLHHRQDPILHAIRPGEALSFHLRVTSDPANDRTTLPRRPSSGEHNAMHLWIWICE